MTSSPGAGFRWVVASMAGSLYEIWRKGRHVPRAPEAHEATKTRKAPNAPWPAGAFLKAKRAEYMRLASTIHYVRVPHLDGHPTGEKLVLSLPVLLYESRENRLLKGMSLAAINRSNDLMRAHPIDSARKKSIVLVDRGTLMLTHRRILFTSQRKLREFPLRELTVFSTTLSSVALAARWRFGISYFRGIDATRLTFRTEPEEGEQWEGREFSFNMTGQDIREIVNILLAAPILNYT
ncbi:MAG: hypothetical protein M3Y30_10985 [Gemmatimonadota bacterium]|nr:hypothetical protein [Gemmatimonadota bacterium]